MFSTAGQLVFTAMQLCGRGISMNDPSVGPSVCLSNAWIVIKRKKQLSIQSYNVWKIDTCSCFFCDTLVGDNPIKRDWSKTPSGR